ncbi:MAG: hypothetical protein NTX86_00835 [Candidatus Dependentiae bacterium]|nr:hypothetical protein [Candidatus Dependentiae bacterium]
MLLGIIRVTFIITLCASFAWMLYSLNIFAIGWMLFPFSLSLLLTGWILGFCTAGLIMHGGMRLNWANWAIGYFISPFIGMYYPVKTLPTWLQCIAYSLPPTYVFEGMRSMMEENIPRIDYMAISLALNVMYLALAIMFFKAMFEKSRARGLARIE